MQNKNAEMNFFNTAVNESPWTSFNKNGQKQIFALFKESIKPQKGEITLDMGCGTGEFSEKLLEYGLKVTGIDISKNAIEQCKKKYNEKNILFDVQDIEKTTYANNSVDIIFYGGVLHHFPNRLNVFKEAYRILKKGGRIYGFDPNFYNLTLWIYREKLKIKTQKTENEVLIKAKDIETELKKTGFSEITVKSTANITFDIEYFKKLVPFPVYYGVYIYNIIERITQKIKPIQTKYGSFVITYAKK
ncbi:MAG: class I SAM-dependent methyltransferase [Candidatus Woesearchaeota archaeon]|jgi:ubiquinone/menaquinone biosynthesis C-methylase UbiE